MTVYAIMYYEEAIGIWQLGGIFRKEEDARAEANHYNLIWGAGHAFVISKEVQ